jgi:hypothetical protein
VSVHDVIRCQFIILARKDEPIPREIRCQFIILARKDEPIPDYPSRKDVLTPDYLKDVLTPDYL